MDQLYLPITILLFIAMIVRIPTAIRQPHARAAWFATCMAIPALLTRGAIIPIQTLDAWLGGQNIIFLAQCWLATFAFWGLCEAAGADTTREERTKIRLWIPLVWCVIYTIPFFFIDHREGTELFFIDAHVDSVAAILCGVLYMMGIAAICARLIWTLRDRKAATHWVFRGGAALVIAGSILWSTAIVIDHVLELHRTPIVWMYTGFDILFYPGVIALALGLMSFALQRLVRTLILRRRVRALQAILTRRGITSAATGGALPFMMYDLVIQIEDLRTLGKVAPTEDEAKEIARSAAWVERTFPQIHDFSIA